VFDSVLNPEVLTSSSKLIKRIDCLCFDRDS